MKVLNVNVAPYNNEGGRYFVVEVDDKNIESFVFRYDSEVVGLLNLINDPRISTINTVVSTLPEKLTAPIVLKILKGAEITITQQKKTNSYGDYIVTKVTTITNVEDSAIINVVNGVKALLDPMKALESLL